MNIKCNYCGSEFDETLEKCPNCSASNINVKRSVIDQPTTIEELKEWYSARHLPSYETTRFFIGIDYKGPRAFGIYRDESTGNFVVYKNKDTGHRAVRYEGTDEAYAVNELFMRLKQEILEQKSRNIDSRKASYRTAEEKKASEEEKDEAYKTFIHKDTKEEAEKREYLRLKGEAEYAQKRNRTIVVGVIAALVICLIFGYASFRAYVNKQTITEGYYEYNNGVYYHRGTDDFGGWFKYDSDENDWYKADVSAFPLVDKLGSRKFFVTEEDYSTLGCSDVRDSADYKISIYGYEIGQEYYKVGDHYYYHAESDNSLGWFRFNLIKNDWDYSTFSNLPKVLQQQYTAVDYIYDYYGEKTHSFPDVKQSEAYKNTYPAEFASYPKESKAEGYYSKDDKIYYHNISYDPTSWYEYNDQTSQWDYTYQVPDDVKTYSPNYSSISDFTETQAYTSSHPDDKYSYSSDSGSSKTNSGSWWSSSDDDSWSSSDSSWDWGGSDSWDSGSTDWSSDW